MIMKIWNSTISKKWQFWPVLYTWINIVRDQHLDYLATIMDEDKNNLSSANSSHVDPKKLTMKLGDSAANIGATKMMEGLKVREEVRRRASTGEMIEEREKVADKCMGRRGSARKDTDTLTPSFYVPMRWVLKDLLPLPYPSPAPSLRRVPQGNEEEGNT